jgi:hypothetical protein
MAWNALNSSQGGAERMRRLVRNMNPEQRRIVARANWDRMMTSPQGNPIDPGRWATKWLNLPQEQKHLLFSETTDVGALDDLAVVLREQASGGAGRNTSGTSYDLQRADMVKSALRGLAAMTTGTMTGFPTETAITAGLGYGLAEAFYHPAVIRRALEAVTRTGQAAGPVPRAAGQAVTTQMRDLLGGQ